MVVKRIVVGTREEVVYIDEVDVSEGWDGVVGGSMEVIFRREGSVRMRLLERGLLLGVEAGAGLVFEAAVLEVVRAVRVELGRRDWVRKVRLVSTCDS